MIQMRNKNINRKKVILIIFVTVFLLIVTLLIVTITTPKTKFDIYDSPYPGAYTEAITFDKLAPRLLISFSVLVVIESVILYFLTDKNKLLSFIPLICAISLVLLLLILIIFFGLFGYLKERMISNYYNIYDNAIATNNPELCKKIPELIMNNQYANKFSCYKVIAYNTDNPALCKEIKEGHSWQYFSECIAKIGEKTGNLQVCDYGENNAEKLSCVKSVAVKQNNVKICDIFKGKNSTIKIDGRTYIDETQYSEMCYAGFAEAASNLITK